MHFFFIRTFASTFVIMDFILIKLINQENRLDEIKNKYSCNFSHSRDVLISAARGESPRPSPRDDGRNPTHRPGPSPASSPASPQPERAASKAAQPRGRRRRGVFSSTAAPPPTPHPSPNNGSAARRSAPCHRIWGLRAQIQGAAPGGDVLQEARWRVATASAGH